MSCIETCMEPVCLVLKPVWNLYVLSCLTPDFCLALICLDFVYLYKRGVLYAQILSFAVIPLTRLQAAPNVTEPNELPLDPSLINVGKFVLAPRPCFAASFQ